MPTPFVVILHKREVEISCYLSYCMKMKKWLEIAIFFEKTLAICGSFVYNNRACGKGISIFMPFFSSVPCDDVGCGCTLMQETLTEYVRF